MLMAMVLAAFALQNWIATRRSYISQTGKPADLEKTDLGAWRWPVIGVFSLVALIGVVIPLAAIAVTSLTGTISGGLRGPTLIRAIMCPFSRKAAAPHRPL